MQSDFVIISYYLISKAKIGWHITSKVSFLIEDHWFKSIYYKSRQSTCKDLKLDKKALSSFLDGKRPDIDIFRFISFALVNLLVDCPNSISRQSHCLAQVNVGVNISWQEAKGPRKCVRFNNRHGLVWSSFEICQTENASRNAKHKKR